jgi:hypothetical protein
LQDQVRFKNFFCKVNKWYDYCLMPNEQFFRCIIARTSYISMRWWSWCRDQHAELAFYSASSLKATNTNFLVFGLTITHSLTHFSKERTNNLCNLFFRKYWYMYIVYQSVPITFWQTSQKSVLEECLYLILSEFYAIFPKAKILKHFNLFKQILS